jgi:hypothetical protein
MATNQIAHVVAYRDTDCESDAQAWKDGDFEVYNFYNLKDEADSIANTLRSELKANRRKDVKVFVHSASKTWCENNLL